MVYKIMSSMIDGLLAFIKREPLVAAIIAYVLYQLYLSRGVRWTKAKTPAPLKASPSEAMPPGLENTEALADFFDQVEQVSDDETRLNAELLAYDAAATEHEYFVATDPSWNHRSANENSALVA